eukprot:COSAG05_NODE_932_length_6542_cov_8.110818_1_plen_395_part_00
MAPIAAFDFFQTLVMCNTALLLGWAAATASTVSPAQRPRLAFWVEGPVNGGCPGWGLPFPGYSAVAKSEPSCWNNTLTMVAQHANLIDELELSVGLSLTNVSKGLIDLDRDGSEWGSGFREKPQEWWPHFVPQLRRVLKPGTKIVVPFFFGGGASYGNSTEVAQQAYGNADALANQLVQLATTNDWIDGYNLDYEADCGLGCDPRSSGYSPQKCLRSRAICVPREAASLSKLFRKLSNALHAANKTLGFCTNKNGAGFEHWQFYQSYLDAGIDRLYEMGTYLNHSHNGGPSDRENVTRELLEYPLGSTAFGLGDYGHDTASEAEAWLSELLERSQAMPGQLTVHVYNLFGARPQQPDAPDSCGLNHTEFDHYCPRPPQSWWMVLNRFHRGNRGE